MTQQELAIKIPTLHCLDSMHKHILAWKCINGNIECHPECKYQFWYQSHWTSFIDNIELYYNVHVLCGIYCLFMRLFIFTFELFKNFNVCFRLLFAVPVQSSKVSAPLWSRLVARRRNKWMYIIRKIKKYSLG